MKSIVVIAAACAIAAGCSPQSSTPAPPADGGGATASGQMAHNGQASNTMAMMAPTAGDTEATRGYKASMMSMMENMPAYVGNPDTDFMTQMRVHHQAAIAMARVELDQGQNADAKALAQEIVTAQEREIGVIDAWLAANPN